MRCPLCKNEKKFEYIESIYSEEMNIEYKIFKCLKCEIEFSHPMKPAPPSHYEKFEWYGERLEFYESLKFIKKFEVKKILEIGCGEGYFLKMVQDAGFEVCGIDFNKKAIEIAKNRFKIKEVHDLTLEEFIKKFPDKKFDGVCFFHLIEHLEDPLKFVLELKKVLKKKGFIFFSLPYYNRISVKIGLREGYDFPPNHLTRWSQKSIKFLLKNNNFKIIFTKKIPYSLDEVLNMLMQKFSLGIIKKIEEKRNEVNLDLDEKRENSNIIFRLIKFKKLFLKPFALILFISLKLLKLDGKDYLIIARSIEYGDNGEKADCFYNN